MWTVTLILGLRRLGGLVDNPSPLCPPRSLPHLLFAPAFLWGFASLLLFPGFSGAVTGSTEEVERKEAPVCDDGS